MPLEPFVAANVSPGEPLTAQAWNEIVQQLRSVTDHILSSEASAVRVQVANDSAPPDEVRVTAIPEEGVQTFQAIGPIPPATEHVFAGLRPGVYTVRASAPGFAAATAVVTVPTEEVVSLTMTPRGARMPALFGLRLGEALQELQALNIAVERVLDAAGREIAPGNPSQAERDVPVLVQVPDPGVPVPPDGRARLGVAAELRVQPAIEVPSLAGLTLSEAQRALESAGLTLGRVETRRPESS